MIFLNCLWVGVLGGLVGSRLIRVGGAYASLGGSIAVGVLGALLGGLTDMRGGAAARQLPHVDILAAGVGAATALALWSLAQRLLPRPSKNGSGNADRSQVKRLVADR